MNPQTITAQAKGWRTTVAACCAMLVVGAVAVVTRDVAIIASVSGVVTTLLLTVTQRHTSADLYNSTPGGVDKRPPA